MLHRVEECWVLPRNAFVALTVEKALSLIEDCFFHAQAETLARVKQRLTDAAEPPPDEAIRRNVRQLLRITMRENLDDFDHPTVEGLGRLVSSLRGKATAWGTPADIVGHHCGQISELLISLASAVPKR